MSSAFTRLPVFLLLTGAPVAAQEARLTVEPLVSYRGPTALYLYQADAPAPSTTAPGTFRFFERLRLRGAIGFGGRVALRVGGGWSAFAQASRARTWHEYRREESVVGTPPYSVQTVDSRSTVTTLSAGASRVLWTSRLGTSVAAEVAAGVMRADMTQLRFPQLAPSYGYSQPTLGRYELVEPRYDVPTAGVALAVRQAIGRRVSAQVRVAYSAGRADTHTFRSTWPSGFEYLNEPTASRVASPELAAGLSVRLW